jgi:hypothetical protein
MTFKYDQNKFNEYRWDDILHILPAFIVVIPMGIKYIREDIKNSLFIIIISAIILFFLIIIRYNAKVVKNKFYSFFIECNDKNIKVVSDYRNYEIKIDEIKKISKDNKNNFYIITKKNKKAIINHFIENTDSFENYLSNIKNIEPYNSKLKIFRYFPIVLINVMVLFLAFDKYILSFIFTIIFFVIIILIIAYQLIYTY